jgi:hypothetical protein
MKINNSINFDINQIEKNIDIILSLINPGLPLFPINVMTAKSKGQIEVKNRKEILKEFYDSNFLDCRINAYSVYCGYNGLNNTKKVMIMIDLDLSTFEKYKNPQNYLDKSLKNTINKLKQEINSNPLILWTGGGYHIYQPIYFEELLVSETFNKYSQNLNQNLTNLFMRFAKWYFTDGEADSSQSFNKILFIESSRNNQF